MATQSTLEMKLDDGKKASKDGSTRKMEKVRGDRCVRSGEILNPFPLSRATRPRWVSSLDVDASDVIGAM